MRLLAATCAGMFFCLSIARLGHAQEPAVDPADAGVAAPAPAGPPAEVVSAADGPSASEPSPSPTTATGATSTPSATSDPSAQPNPAIPPPAETPSSDGTYAPTPYEASPGPSSGSTGVNRRFAYGVPAHSWIRRPGPGAREHEGFYARLTLGIGASQASYRESVDGTTVQDITTRGIALLFDGAIGGRLVRNLILHASLSLASTLAAHKDVNGARYANETIDSSTGLFGAGLTYYLMPYNAYLTASFGVTAFAESRDERESIESRSGFGGVALLGKEWWAGPRGEWGLGVALRFSYMGAPLEIADIESSMRANDIGIVFSATYN